MKNSFIFIILFLQYLSVNSQTADTANHYFTGFQAHYGFIIAHTAKVEPVSHTNPYGFEFSFNKLNTSMERWKIFNHYNISGIQVSYFNFQNPRILGSAFVFTIFTEPIISFSNKWLFSIKAGTGFSYHTKIYDPEKNPLNTFFSTRISFPLYLMARFKYRVSGNSYITLSGSFNHISNGAINLPNYGMNFPTLLLGIEHFQKPLPILRSDYIRVRNSKVSSQYLIIQTLTGYKIVYGERVYAFGLHTRYTWQIRTHYALNAGAEVILDGGVKRNIEVENLELDYKRVALTGGQDFIFGKVIFTQYFGYYIYAPCKAKNSFYQKYELSYRIVPEFMAGLYLKAHSSDAELAGLSLSYILHCR
jgi:hypothetical protein